jgi:quercetin dioxygenase-like cupin family protein
VDDAAGDDRLSFLGRPLPREFVLRVVTIAPGGAHGYDEAEWRDALVVVERGAIELECQAGGRRRFEQGAVMWLAGLALRALHNPASEPAVVVGVARRRAARLGLRVDGPQGRLRQ